MSRQFFLQKTLGLIMTEEEINYFQSYKVTKSDMLFLTEAIGEVLTKIPANAFNCAMLSGMLGAIINDHSSIPVSVVSGHLDYSSKRIFHCDKPISYSTEKKEINEIWNGHCWVEINNLIIDISIFRTIYYGQVPRDLYDNILNQFGTGRGALVASPADIEKLKFDYTPCYCLSQNQITALVLGAGQI